MSYKNLPAGKNPPKEVNMVVENPTGSMPVKYELDKDYDLMKVDRFRYGTNTYPYNYGFIPQTLAGDGDPIDVMLVSVGTGSPAVMAGAFVEVRPIGVMMMEDDGGPDEKIIVVPLNDPYHDDIEDVFDLPEIVRGRIKDFFQNYKNMEAGKWTEIGEFEGVKKAQALIEESIERFKNPAEAPSNDSAPQESVSAT